MASGDGRVAAGDEGAAKASRVVAVVSSGSGGMSQSASSLDAAFESAAMVTSWDVEIESDMSACRVRRTKEGAKRRVALRKGGEPV